MKRMPLGVLVMMMAFAPIALGQVQSSVPASVEEDLKKLDHKWLDSERTGDLDYCEKFFADSYVLVLTNGKTFTKTQWLGILRGPERPTLEVLDPSDIKGNFFGKGEITTG